MIQNYIYMKMYNDIYIYIIHNMCPREEKPNTFMPQVMLSKKRSGWKVHPTNIYNRPDKM
jgi:hypothetical protein